MAPQGMTFEGALYALKAGKKVMRAGWNLNRMREGNPDPKMYVEAQRPDEHSKMGRPYLFIVPSEDSRVPWVPSQTDLFAEDWYEYEVPVKSE